MYTKEDIELINKEFEGLRLASLEKCATPEEHKVVLRAFEFAKEAHKGVRRRSGEPYILHPISVAKIVVKEIGLGYKSIAAALLHDIVEDTEYTVEDIDRLFGGKIASLVDGLTKIKSAMDNRHNTNGLGGIVNTNLDFGEAETIKEISEQAENFKRILLTLNDDVRVILIKLADRLHNLRTIGSMPERKKDKILSETMYIFIPLAHRLGLYELKSEMENIWLEYREPDAYISISRNMENIVREKEVAISKFIDPIANVLDNNGIKYSISKRTKTPYSVWRKMENKGIPFSEIYDLYAVRIIFEPSDKQSERNQCWDIYTRISELYISKTDRIRDWVSSPKSNGYEALHCTLMSNQGNWIEVQIRTSRMNEVAEKGIAAHWSYKGVKVNKSELEMDRWLNMVSDVLNNPNANAIEFLDRFHDGLLTSEIYVFTPKGDSKPVAKGSTALDFAYSIHSEIGNRAIAAKVNLKLVPLSFILRNGDQVEIVTSENNRAQREWLEFVKTSKAKSAIYDSLKGDHKEAIHQGQIILENELDKYGVKPQQRVFKKLQLAYNVNSKEELYIKVYTGLVDLSNLESVLKNNTENKLVKYWNLQFFSKGNKDKEEEEDKDKDKDKKEREQENKKRENQKPNIDKKKDYLLKENLTDNTLTYKVAECCNPIPGDTVIGFLDKNNNVTVHKKTCPIAISLAAREGGNIVNAKWTKHTVLSFLCKVEIKGIDRLGIVSEITQYITKILNVNIRKIHFETHDAIFEGYLELYVHNSEDLDDMIKNVLKIKGVDFIKRVNVKEINK